MSDKMNDAVRQAEEAVKKKQMNNESPEVDPEINSEKPESNAQEDDGLLLKTSDTDDHQDSDIEPKNKAAHYIDSMPVAQKICLIAGIVIAIFLFGPSSGDDPVTTIQDPVTPTSDINQPVSGNEDVDTSDFDKLFDREMDTVNVPEDVLIFEETALTSVESTDPNDVVTIDVKNSDLVAAPQEMIVEETSSAQFKTDESNESTDALVFPSSSKLDTDSQVQHFDIDTFSADEVDNTCSDQIIVVDTDLNEDFDNELIQDPNETPVGSSKMEDEKVVENTIDNTQVILDTISVQNDLLKKMAAKIDALEKAVPGNDYNYSPNLDVLYIAPASKHCDTCLTYAVVMYKGDKVHLANKESFIGYKAIIDDNRLKLSKNGIEHSYFPVN